MAKQIENFPSSPSERERNLEMDLRDLREQKDQALACLILSAAIGLAMILFNFPGDRRPTASAREQVELHKKLLLAAQQVLVDNQKVLNETRVAFDRVRKK